MKHAYLIIVHNEYSVLETLLSMIDDERNDIYLHIDRRSTELYKRACLLCTQKARLFLLPTRNKVYWGDISQVETEYLLLETAAKHSTYDYYHLLSGVDLPIQTQVISILSFKPILVRNLSVIGWEINTRKI